VLVVVMVGRPRDVVGRRWVFDLLGAGMSVEQVAVVTGVSRSAIHLWRGQVGGVIPRVGVVSPRFLSRDERYEIARLRDGGRSVREIARVLGRDPGTISRELVRNRDVRSGGYQPERAHSMAHGRRCRPKPTRLDADAVLRRRVQDYLDLDFSPQQIAGRLIMDFPEDQRMRISPESIYQAIYIRAGGGLRRELRAHLRTHRRSRRTRASRSSRQPGPGQITDMISIHDRPVEVEGRLIPGHHEGDLIMGSTASNSAIATIVERTTGYLTLVHLPHGHSAQAVAQAITTQITQAGRLPAALWKTMTWDRGREMARHADITAATDLDIYFADAYSPWQRGSNENINGLIRQYFPKGTDLSLHSPQRLQEVADRLNNRPRQRLGFLTPNEVITKLIEEDKQRAVATIT
jgi:IS30 family transposase